MFFCLERIFFSIFRPVIVFTSSSFREIAVCFMTILPFHRRVMFLLSLTKNVAHAVDVVSKERKKDADQWLPHRDSGKISSLLLENVPILWSWAWGAKNARINLPDECVCVCVVCVGILRRSKTSLLAPRYCRKILIDAVYCCRGSDSSLLEKGHEWHRTNHFYVAPDVKVKWKLCTRVNQSEAHRLE